MTGKKYQYKVIRMFENPENTLNELGKQGWQLVVSDSLISVDFSIDGERGRTFYREYILEREI